VDHDLCCDSSEKYVSSDGDNDDASTMTRSSGGSIEEAADNGADDDDDDGEEEDHRRHVPCFPHHSVMKRQGLYNVKSAPERNNLQQALERLASLSRTTQNSFSNSIINRSWFSDNTNSNVTPASSVGASHYFQTPPQSNFGSLAVGFRWKMSPQETQNKKERLQISVTHTVTGNTSK